MSDIFISYAKEDREWVISLADVLRQQGWTVWWDRSIPFGQSFQEVIEKELNEAQCAIVVWSRHSVDSGWVSAEADEARNRNILVPVLIDDAKPPLVFRQLQTANLTDWDGDSSTPVFRKLSTDISALLGHPVSQSSFATPGDNNQSSDQNKSYKWLGVAGLASIFAASALWFSNLRETPPPELPIIQEFRVDNAQIKTGDSMTLIWVTTNASSVEISELGDVALSGSTRVRPEKSSIYTLIAKNKQGKSTQKTVEAIIENKEEAVVENSPDPQLLISKFNESLVSGRLDLAEEFFEKASNLVPDHPEVLKIRDKLAEQKQAEAKKREQLLVEQRQEEERQIAEQKKQEEDQWREQEALKREEENRLVAEKKNQEEAERQKNEALQSQAQEQKLAEEQRRKEEEARKKADQEKANIVEEQKRLAKIEQQEKHDAELLQKEEQQRQEELAAEKKKIEDQKHRQQELEKQKALQSPVPIVVRVDGVEKRFNRDGLLASSLREAAVQQLRAAGFKVVSANEAKSNKESVVMLLAFKYIENTSAGFYSYSARTMIIPTSSNGSQTLWEKGHNGIARSVELKKVNDVFAKNVEKFIHDHPQKGLEFKNNN